MLLRKEPTEEAGVVEAPRRPRPKPPPRPISRASAPTTMGTQTATPPEPLVVDVDGVVPELDDVATGVGDVTAAALTVKTKAAWSGAPSSAEWSIPRTT